jgi:hypothetical protein
VRPPIVTTVNNRDSDETFYRRFTLPEERKGRLNGWDGGYRWFISPNVVKLEDHRPPGEMSNIFERLRQHRRDQAVAAVVNIMAKAKCRGADPSQQEETT